MCAMTLNLPLRILRLAIPAFVVVMCASTSAQAQLTSAGTTLTGNAGESGGLNDLAYDEVHDVYLHVYGGSRIWGQFVRGNGTAVGARFAVTGSPLTFANWLHVAYSTGGPADIFLVTFGAEYASNNGKSIFGQLVKFNGNGGELVGGAFPISELGITKNIFQSSGTLAFSNQLQKFLVSWEDLRGNWDVIVRFVNTDGTMSGGEMNLSATGASGEGQPSVAYNWQTNQFLVVFKSWQQVGPAERGGVYGFLLDGNGQKISGRITINEGFYRMELPSVLFLPETGKYFVFWMDEVRSGVVDVAARIVGGDGTPQGGVFPALAPGWNGVPDGDYDRITRQILISGQHDSGFAWSGLVSGDGVTVGANFKGSSIQWARGGTYYPQVAAGSNGQFGVGYVVDYSSGWIERWTGPAAATPGPARGGTFAPPPPPPPPTTIDLNAPNGNWFFAEGVATNDGLAFDTKYIFVNESDDSVDVRGYFAKDDGTAYPKTYTVPARTRKTISLKSEIGVGNYSAVLQSLTPSRQVYASREVTWGSGGYGSTSEVATSTRGRTWYFAEGSRNFEFFQNFFLVFNPTQTDANVTFTFYKPDGSRPTASAVVKAQSRYTLWANTVAGLANSDFSVRIDSDHDVVAERSMYWGNNFEGGHDSLGTATGNNSWYFAEGAAAPGFETYYTILNPNNTDVTVDITYFLDAALGQAPRVLSYVVPRNSRYTVQLNSQLGNVGGCSALITSRNGEALVAERSIYWGRTQFGVDGTNVVGATAPAMIWHIPQGSFEAGTDSFILIANPNTSEARVNVQLYLENGQRYTEVKTIPAGSRVTLYMRTDFTSNTADQASLNGQRYTVKVQSVTLGAPVFVEHATYSGSAGVDYWRAGSAAFGIPQ